jgi:hypothetical protein
MKAPVQFGVLNPDPADAPESEVESTGQEIVGLRSDNLLMQNRPHEYERKSQ